MSAPGRGYTKPWRVSYYVRDVVTGRPTGGGRRAFALQRSAEAFRDEQRAAGWTVECWREDTLPGVT